jgi:hypothetical protein
MTGLVGVGSAGTALALTLPALLVGRVAVGVGRWPPALPNVRTPHPTPHTPTHTQPAHTSHPEVPYPDQCTVPLSGSLSRMISTTVVHPASFPRPQPGLGAAPAALCLYSEWLPARARGANLLSFFAFFSLGAVLQAGTAWVTLPDPTLGIRALLWASAVVSAGWSVLAAAAPRTSRTT